MDDQKWLLGIDLEGTLAMHNQAYRYPSVWPVLAETLGTACMSEEDAVTDCWNRGEIESYRRYMELTIALHRKYGLTRDIFERVIEAVPWINGIPETFAEVRRRKGQIAIITGGFANHAERVPGREYVSTILAACKYHFDPSGELTAWDLADYEGAGKVAALERLAEPLGLDLKRDVCFVTDGKNDVPVARAVPRTIALNAHQDLREATSIHVDATDLCAILQHLPE